MRARWLGGWAEALGLAPGMEVELTGRSDLGHPIVLVDAECHPGHCASRLVGVPASDLVLVRGPHDDVTDEALGRYRDRRLVEALEELGRPGAEL